MSRWQKAKRVGVSIAIALSLLPLPGFGPILSNDAAAEPADPVVPADTPPFVIAQSPSKKKEESRFTPLAQEYLERAKAQLAAERAAKTEKSMVQERQKAQELAIQVSQERARKDQEQEREAQRQLKLAREQQLKNLYNQGLSRYKQKDYQGAIDCFQQMVLIDPDHSLVKAADKLIARAELKHFEQRLRSSTASNQPLGASVPELEDLLTQKRLELETAFKYAEIALRQKRYDTAQKLLTAVLVQDPSNKEAQDLMQRVELARLGDERDRLVKLTDKDNAEMINDVLKAQLLPEAKPDINAKPAHLLLKEQQAALSAKLQQPISFEFNAVALADVLEFLADAANVSIVPSPQLDLKSQLVTLKVKELPLEHAIKYLVRTMALDYRLEQDAVLIAPPGEFANEPIQTRVFFLHNGLSPFALQTSAVMPNPALEAETIVNLLEQTIPSVSGGKFIIDERNGALVVTNTESNLRLIEKLLTQLDVAPIQVLIEARFIELTLTELEQLGLESVLTGNVALDKTMTPNATRDAAIQLSSGSGLKFPALARENEGANVTLEGVLTGTQFEMVLHALEEMQKTKTLSAPRVTTLNNQTATIRVVEEFNYPTRYEVSLIQFDINGDGDFDDAGETEFANVPQDFQKRDIGILLNVTPSIGKDLKTITLVLAPEVSQFSQFRDLGGGVTVPEFTSSQLTTSVAIENGQTVVLGGLMKDSMSDELTKVPVLGDLPLVGGLFRQHEESTTKKNLLIFITARILEPRGQTT